MKKQLTIFLSVLLLAAISCKRVNQKTSDITPPQDASILINSGDAVTTSTSVVLTLSATEAYDMYVTNTAGCAGEGSWESYSTTKSWVLAQTNTTATVYVKYRDRALNETSCVSDTILHDDTAPQGGGISINGGAAATNSTTVTLTLSATGADKMYVTNDAGCATGGNWVDYAGTFSWELGQTNALATVYVKYRDSNLNETGCLSDTITHDNQAPSGASVSINSNATYTNTTSVTLTLAATGASQMCVTNTAECGCANSSDWETYNTTKAWTLGQTNATATVYVKYRDVALNESACINDTIIHDNQAPTGDSISINSNATYATSTSVTLTLGATGASQMCVTNTAGCSCANSSDWETYNTTKAWTLGQTNATATVYVKYRDAALNETACINDTIIHDNQAPTDGSVSINNGDASTTSTSVTLTLNATGASDMYITNTAGCAADGTLYSYATTQAWTLGQTNGTATVYVKFIDAAGNESACLSDTITHDNQAPTGGSILINNGDSSTASTSVTLTLNATGASNMYITNTSGCAADGTLYSYAATKAWTLGQSSGTATVYIKFIDSAGNESSCLSDTISVFPDVPFGVTGEICDNALLGANFPSLSLDSSGNMFVGLSNTVRKYDLYGSLVTAFGSNGEATLFPNNSNGLQMVNGVAVQSDGKIVATGAFQSGFSGGAGLLVLARITGEGQPDNVMWQSGLGLTYETALPPTWDYYGLGHYLDIQPSGRILVATSALAPNSNGRGVRSVLYGFDQATGALDTSFGPSNGYLARLPFTMQPDGKIIVVDPNYPGGGAPPTLEVRRYESDGKTLDATFGTAGVASFNLFTDNQGLKEVIVSPSGKIFIYGTGNNDSGEPLSDTVRYLLSLNADGTRNTAFDTDGFLTFPYFYMGTQAFAVQADDSVLVRNAAPEGIVRYTPAGIIDSSFAGDGVFDVGDAMSGRPNYILITPDNKIVFMKSQTCIVRLRSNGVYDSARNHPAFNWLGENNNWFSSLLKMF